MKHELEQSIVEAMRMSDYNEMMLRVKAMQKENKAHGSVEVSAGYNSDSGKSFVRSSTTVNQTDSAGSRSLLKEGIPMKYDSVSVSYPERLDKRYPFHTGTGRHKYFSLGRKRFSKRGPGGYSDQ